MHKDKLRLQWAPLLVVNAEKDNAKETNCARSGHHSLLLTRKKRMQKRQTAHAVGATPFKNIKRGAPQAQSTMELLHLKKEAIT